jgi:ribosome-binding factor A
VLARARALDEEVAARRGTAYAGEEDPYKKPREDDDLDDDAAEDVWDDAEAEDEPNESPRPSAPQDT